MSFKDLKNLGGMVQNMQEQMQKMQADLERQEVTAEAAAGLVKVTMNGKHDIVKIELDDSLLGEEKSFVEDVIAAGVNAANVKIKAASQEAMSNATAGLNLPKGFSPFG